jgi:hypothetical protein
LPASGPEDLSPSLAHDSSSPIPSDAAGNTQWEAELHETSVQSIGTSDYLQWDDASMAPPELDIGPFVRSQPPRTYADPIEMCPPPTPSAIMREELPPHVQHSGVMAQTSHGFAYSATSMHQSMNENFTSPSGWDEETFDYFPMCPMQKPQQLLLDSRTNMPGNEYLSSSQLEVPTQAVACEDDNHGSLSLNSKGAKNIFFH